MILLQNRLQNLESDKSDAAGDVILDFAMPIRYVSNIHQHGYVIILSSYLISYNYNIIIIVIL